MRPRRCSRRPKRGPPRKTDGELPRAHHPGRRRMPREKPEESTNRSPRRSSGDCASLPPPPSPGRTPATPDRSGVQLPPMTTLDATLFVSWAGPLGGSARHHYHSALRDAPVGSHSGFGEDAGSAPGWTALSRRGSPPRSGLGSVSAAARRAPIPKGLRRSPCDLERP